MTIVQTKVTSGGNDLANTVFSSLIPFLKKAEGRPHNLTSGLRRRSSFNLLLQSQLQ